jgi:hypothetical protein
LSVMTVRQAAALHTAINATTTDHAEKGDQPMNLFRKNGITPSSRAFGALILLTALTTSPAVHASSAFLNRAINRACAPLIEAGLVPSKKIVTLATGVEAGGGLYPLHLVSSTGEAVAEYVVPAGQNLVVTTVEITPTQSGTTFAPATVYLEETQYVEYKIWLVSNLVSTSFEYPTGFVVQAGSAPVVQAQMGCIITIHGYLTPA